VVDEICVTVVENVEVEVWVASDTCVKVVVGDTTVNVEVDVKVEVDVSVAVEVELKVEVDGVVTNET
jgi:hypothetical protein